MRKFYRVFMGFGFGLGLFCLSGAALAATTVNLGAAGNFTVLGGSTITNTGSTVVNGDLGLSPGTSLTGFPPGVITGTKHITDAVAAQAQTDLVTAYNNAAGQTGAVTISGDLGGRILGPGVYNSASSIGLTGTLTLDGQGNPNAVFIFQIGSALTTAPGSSINFINGAQACNVYWQVGSSATLGTNSTFAGILMSLQSVTVTTGASINGRVLARNGAVTLDASAVTPAVCGAAVVVPVVVTPPVVSPVSVPAPIVGLLAPTVPISQIVTPKLPNTGLAPKNTSAPWQVIIPVAILASLALFFLAKNKQKI